MRRSRFTDEQMVKMLREADRASVADVAKKHGVSEQTVYLWRKKFGDDGRITLALRSPWPDGTTHQRFTPLELVEKLAALVPRPHENLLVYYYGVFAARAKDRANEVAYGRPRVDEPEFGRERGRTSANGCGLDDGSEQLRSGAGTFVREPASARLTA